MSKNNHGKGWWGVDLDGTIAKYNGWRPDGSIGEPIERAVKKVTTCLA